MELNKKKQFFILVFTLLLWYAPLFGQENTEDETEYIEQTYFSTRIAHNPSVETLEKGVLDFRLGHRMGRLSSGFSEFFGLNQAYSQFGIEYGLTNQLMIGMNQNNAESIYSGFIKYKILKQSIGKKEIPLSISWFSNTEIKTGKLNYPNNQYYFSSRLYFTHQLILARKFNDHFSFQISPTLVHKNMVKTSEDHNNIAVLGLASRYKINRKLALIVEYNYIFPQQIFSEINKQQVQNGLSLGIDVFTGKHCFQFFITNATAMNEKTFLTETTENFFNKGIHFGFNISRLFNIVNYYE